jgi:uncharacterized protein (DUF58 family)
MPAGRCLQLLALTTVVVLGGLLEPRLIWLAMACDAGLLLAAAVDLRRAARLPLAAARRWPPLLVQGGGGEVTITIVNRLPRPAIVSLREGLHPALAAAPLRQRVRLPGGTELTWAFRLVPRRRGEHHTAPLTARVLGPWGLAWAQRDLLSGDRVRVYPQVRWEGKVGQLLTLAQRRRMGQLPMRTTGLGSEPYALREYLAGDPLAKIHWKATARHGRLVSREDTWERGSRLVVLLDCARTMASWGGARTTHAKERAAALALTRVAAARGDQVTIFAFSDRVDRTVRVRPGGRGAGLAYAALFDLEARLCEPAYDLAVEAVSRVEPRRATAVLLTSVVDLAAAELLRESLLRLGSRHRALLVNLEDPELRRLAESVPATPAAAFAQVASLEIALANRRLARHLRHAAVRVVTSAADRLALSTLEAYLALYRGRAAGVAGMGSREAAMRFSV